VDVGGRWVEVPVRFSTRARRARIVVHPDRAAEIVVPARAGLRAADRVLLEHGDWLRRQLVRMAPPALELPSLSEAEGRRAARAAVTLAAEREAPRLGVTYARIRIGDMRTRWGSCSPQGTLSFNWRLALAPAEVLEYVVVHELCHLRVLDHSARFWRLLERTRPGYRDQLEWLRDHGWELLRYRAVSPGAVAPGEMARRAG
jgi:predicted metal-dependent hydrolase